MKALTLNLIIILLSVVPSHAAPPAQVRELVVGLAKLYQLRELVYQPNRMWTLDDVDQLSNILKQLPIPSAQSQLARMGGQSVTSMGVFLGNAIKESIQLTEQQIATLDPDTKLEDDMKVLVQIIKNREKWQSTQFNGDDRTVELSELLRSSKNEELISLTHQQMSAATAGQWYQRAAERGVAILLRRYLPSVSALCEGIFVPQY